MEKSPIPEQVAPQPQALKVPSGYYKSKGKQKVAHKRCSYPLPEEYS